MPPSKKPPLRVVTDQPAAKKRRSYRSVASARRNGDRLDVLLAMEARLAGLIDNPNTPAKDISPLVRRLQEVGRDIEAIREQGQAQEDVAVRAATDDERWDADAI